MDQITCPKCGEKIEISEAIRTQIESDLKKNLEHNIRARAEAEVGKAKDELSQALKLVRDLKAKDRDREVELQKRLLDEEERIRDEERKRTLEENRLTDLEKDKKIKDMENLVEELKRKAKQGSQQTQGEVLELDLEANLRQAFPTDEVSEVKKGELGADIRQVVKTARGSFCGVILWESKSTKSWSNDWLSKLRSDMLKDKANVPVLVTEALPKGLEVGFGMRDGVWIIKPALIIPVAMMLREGLINTAKEKFVAGNLKGNAEAVYAYVTGYEFVNEVKEMLLTYQGMKEQIDREKRALEKIWKEREIQVQRLLKGTINVYGTLNATSGSSLPKLEALELGGGNNEVA